MFGGDDDGMRKAEAWEVSTRRGLYAKFQLLKGEVRLKDGKIAVLEKEVKELTKAVAEGEKWKGKFNDLYITKIAKVNKLGRMQLAN